MKHLCAFLWGVNMTHSHFCPLIRGQAEHLWRKTKRNRHQAERRSSSGPLTLHPSGLFASPPCLSLCFLYGDLLLVLCAALRKCSTPRSAGRGVGGVGGDWHQPRPSCSISVLFCLLLSVWKLSHQQLRARSPLWLFVFSYRILATNKKNLWCKTG